MNRSISVDEQFLADLLGLEEWPDNVPLNHEFEQMAARAITDAFRPDSPGAPIKASAAISNAVAWIKDAYEMGHSIGITQERQRWEAKIAKIFDLRTR